MLIAGFLLALVFTPISRALALFTGFIDQPKADRVHWVPTPFLGGLAVAVSTGLAFAALAPFVPHLNQLWEAGVLPRTMTSLILLLATGALVLGLCDDRFGVSPRNKLLVQTLLSLMFLASAIGFGLRVDMVLWPVGLLWMIGLTNAFNLLDGMDGIMGGVGTIVGLFLGALALGCGRPDLGALALAGAGASLGFLFFNFPPASIFLGDAGAFFIGFLFAAVGWELGGPEFLVLGSQAAAVTILLAYPIFDVTFVTVTRILEQRPVHQGGLDHTTHRLHVFMRGRRGLIPIYALNALNGVVALAAVQLSAQAAWALVAVMISLYATLGVLLARVPVRRPVLQRFTRRTPAPRTARSRVA
jgi:UDP-GlcNAc:undecaprenyl-phosphate GlcNAc-1-phosphate transferase